MRQDDIISKIKGSYHFDAIIQELKRYIEDVNADTSYNMNFLVLKCIEDEIQKTNIELARHTSVLQQFAIPFGQALGFSKMEQTKLKMVAKYHDIGKIFVPDEILNKIAKLTEEEWEIIKTHPIKSYEILKGDAYYDDIANAALLHHERFDGSGYPKGLKGNEIPPLSRAISILDAYEVLINGRIYKAPVSKEAAMAELERCAGTQFDPEYVKVFKNMMEHHQEKEDTLEML